MQQSSDIFKFIFEHDLRLEQLSGNEDPRQERKRPSTLEEFMKPVQTYSRFYLSGTRMPDQKFGLDVLDNFDRVRSCFFEALSHPLIIDHNIDGVADNDPALLEPGNTFVLGKEAGLSKNLINPQLFDKDLAVREKIQWLRIVLDSGALVLFTEKAHNGVDWHLFSRDNIYEAFFHSFKPLITDRFRFFSINGKRMGSERLFYFETWSLDRPPHGFEEVFPETQLR